jgi:hypothetical protein
MDLLTVRLDRPLAYSSIGAPNRRCQGGNSLPAVSFGRNLGFDKTILFKASNYRLLGVSYSDE